MKKKIGYKIKAIRESMNLSMEDFGKEFSPPASKGVVSNWENDYNYPNESRLKRIAELGKTTTDDILYGHISDRVFVFLNKYIDDNIFTQFKDTNFDSQELHYTLYNFDKQILNEIVRDISIDLMWGKKSADYSKQIEDEAIRLLHERILNFLYNNQPSSNRMIKFVEKKLNDVLHHLDSNYKDENDKVREGVNPNTFKILRNETMDFIERVKKLYVPIDLDFHLEVTSLEINATRKDIDSDCYSGVNFTFNLFIDSYIKGKTTSFLLKGNLDRVVSMGNSVYPTIIIDFDNKAEKDSFSELLGDKPTEFLTTIRESITNLVEKNFYKYLDENLNNHELYDFFKYYVELEYELEI